MLFKEFLEYLSLVKNDWVITDYNYLRTERDCDCPITAVANSIIGVKKHFTPARTQDAIDYLMLDPFFAEKIMSASDNTCMYPELRKKLIETTGAKVKKSRNASS